MCVVCVEMWLLVVVAWWRFGVSRRHRDPIQCLHTKQAHALHKATKKGGKGRHRKQQRDGDVAAALEEEEGEEPAAGCVLEVELVYPEGVLGAEGNGKDGMGEGVIKKGWIEFVKVRACVGVWVRAMCSVCCVVCFMC